MTKNHIHHGDTEDTEKTGIADAPAVAKAAMAGKLQIWVDKVDSSVPAQGNSLVFWRWIESPRIDLGANEMTAAHKSTTDSF